MLADKRTVLFYDGDCALCSRAVQFVLKNEKSADILFAALQDEKTTSFFLRNNFKKPDLSTVYFFENGKLYDKSTAALKIARYLKSPFRLLVVGNIFPKFIRDWGYDVVARNRKRLIKNKCTFSPGFDQRNFFNCDES